MSESPQLQLEGDLKAAMKARDRLLVDTLRMLLTAVKNRRIELGEEVSADDFVALVKKAVKQREEAAGQYRSGAREELAEKEEREIVLLAAYLPEQVGEAELRQAVTEFVTAEGLRGPAAMGQVMKAMIQRFGGAADGKMLSTIAREILTS